MATTVETVTVKIPKTLAAEARRLAEESGRDAQEVLEELLEESLRMRRVPGIVFADGPTGRRARIADTGLEVFEVADVFREAGRNGEVARAAFDWLSETQLQAALEYYATYPREIDERLDRDEYAAIDALWRDHPVTRPRSR